jgi:hemolysin III
VLPASTPFPALPARPPFTRSYDRIELLADAVVHTAGLGLALSGTVLLISAADNLTGIQGASVWIYCIGLITMIGISAVYNLWPVCALKWLLRRFDHSAIYVFIAATYTPFLLQAQKSFNATTFLLVIWCIALIGVMLKLFFPGRLERVSTFLCLALGWSGVLAYDAVFSHLSTSALGFIVAGGLVYSGGVIFHLWDRLRFQNAIWHAFVVVAAALQYVAVFNSVITVGA